MPSQTPTFRESGRAQRTGGAGRCGGPHAEWRPTPDGAPTKGGLRSAPRPLILLWTRTKGFGARKSYGGLGSLCTNGQPRKGFVGCASTPGNGGRLAPWCDGGPPGTRDSGASRTGRPHEARGSHRPKAPDPGRRGVRFDGTVTSGRWTHVPSYCDGLPVSDHPRPFCRSDRDATRPGHRPSHISDTRACRPCVGVPRLARLTSRRRCPNFRSQENAG